MVEMAAAMAILLISAALLLFLMLGMPWWVQAAGIGVALLTLGRVTRWLVRDSLSLNAPTFWPASASTVDFDYLDTGGKLRHALVEVHRVMDYYFEGYCLSDGQYQKFFVSRVNGAIRDRRSGKSFPPKAWLADMRIMPKGGIVSGA